MRIISKFHDFYDSVAALDTDRKNVYTRQEEEIVIPHDQLNTFGQTNRFPIFDYEYKFMKYNGRNWNESIWFNFFIVGFCGELIPCMSTAIKSGDCFENGRYILSETKYEYIYGLDEIEKVLKAKDIDCKWNKTSDIKKKELSEVIQSKLLKQLFFDKKTPVFIYYGVGYNWKAKENYAKLVLNPNLKKIDFQKYLDPYQTYQKIRMFVENDLVQDTQVVVPVGGDIVVLQSKGFDKKTSFRKDKKAK